MKRAILVIGIVMLLVALGASSVSAYYPAGGPGMPWYWVKPGDNLSTIGWMHGVSFWEIARMNGIWNPNVIYPGQMLDRKSVV